MTTAAKPAVQLPPLAEGERYLCGIVNADGSITHTILLPGDNDKANWDDQMAWAKSIGGDLLTRPEQAIAFAKMPEEFQKDWYWSNTQHASDSYNAWLQYFHYGYQTSNYKSAGGRARAVRRLPI